MRSKQRSRNGSCLARMIKNVIAYGEFISAKTISGYEEYTIRLDYRDYRKPKYLVIVATASKYGDYFTGGEGSTLYLDEMELTYD